MDDRQQGSRSHEQGEAPDRGALDEGVAAGGRERNEGRPAGVPGDARPASEGRPSAVRHAEPGPTPPAEQMPTEDPVDRGQTPDTEHQPGGDL